jgi:hypothetical protein
VGQKFLVISFEIQNIVGNAELDVKEGQILDIEGVILTVFSNLSHWVFL